MKMKTILTAAVLALLPGLSFAQCSGERHDQQAMSCAEGMQWDTTTATCVPISTS
jgi:hypothetical protein